MINSFVIVASRKYPIEFCLKAIDNADIPREDLYLLLYLDTKDKYLINYCKVWLDKQKDKWFSKEMIITNQLPVIAKELEEYPNKWQRIIDNMEQIRLHTSFSDIVFMVEDDTIIPKTAFTKLYDKIQKDPNIGCIQGVEALRGQSNGPCGAWFMQMSDNGSLEYKIGLQALKDGIQEIDGGGYYCWAFRQEAMKKIKLRYDLNGWLGPDLLTWFDIKNAGYKTLIDWSVWCGHLDYEGKDLIIRTPQYSRNFMYDFRGVDNRYPKMDFNYKLYD